MVRPAFKDRELVRTKQLLIRVRAQQRKRWQARAKQCGMSLSEWARDVLDWDARAG